MRDDHIIGEGYLGKQIIHYVVVRCDWKGDYYHVARYDVGNDAGLARALAESHAAKLNGIDVS